MFNLGFTEILFIAVLALVLIGPKQLPEVARTVGRFLNELKRSTDAIKDEFKAVALKDDDLKNLYQSTMEPEIYENHKHEGLTSHKTEEQHDVATPDEKKDGQENS